MYRIVRQYTDNTVMTEMADTISAVFNVCAIYTADPDCIHISVMDIRTGETVVCYMA